MSDPDEIPSINPREVLAYLNEMGIRNVSGEMLKEFICDLKKLIKYDLKNRNTENENPQNVVSEEIIRGPERLYSCSTFSSRSKSVKQNNSRKPLSNVNGFNSNAITKMKEVSCKKSNPNAIQTQEVKRLKSASSGDFKTSSGDCKTSSSHNTRVTKGSLRNSNLIRVPIAEKQKKSDPVSLYHYYNSLWEKYKSNRPGENSWAELRWSIREKLLGASQPKPINKVTSVTHDTLAKRREGWREK